MVERPEPEMWSRWVERVRTALDVSVAIDVPLVLDLAGAVSRRFSRPMAPVSACLLGVALGQHPDADPSAVCDAILAACPESPVARPRERDADRPLWQPFLIDAAAAVSVSDELVDIDYVLDVTHRLAHSGARPMAPVAVHLLGIASGERPGQDLRPVFEQALVTAPRP